MKIESKLDSLAGGCARHRTSSCSNKRSSCTLSVRTIAAQHRQPTWTESVVTYASRQARSAAGAQDRHYNRFCFNMEAIFESIPIEWCRCTNPSLHCLRPSSIFRAPQAGRVNCTRLLISLQLNPHSLVERRAAEEETSDTLSGDFLTLLEFLYSGAVGGCRKKRNALVTLTMKMNASDSKSGSDLK